ncbi:metallophosphoesterase [Desulfosporosinus youngiae]|uniref:Putative phosphohydrolase n=1 Tax=Desulfosporosinus youngiae DSM 17734 TaxID=768710 RepID=H5Y413_9FIRM|nr:metallophosphoesterase [Desulfosporosinus youngiae]EHQ89551.1 putative phosphohydrolase [Desulfosporosinus youngiae DSM 17734]
MKLLFVQLSDMHCHSSDHSLTEKLNKAVSAIRTLGKMDGAVLVFSGDLCDTADPNEFKTGRHLLGKFLYQLSEALSCGFIHTKIVPGNHDMILPKGSRGAEEIKVWNKDEHLFEELDRLKSFFAYSAIKHCFVKDKICDVNTITVGDVKLQFCLLNSAPYSTRDPEDKQFHYLPTYVGEKLTRDPEAELKITIMHHHYEWCEWNTKEILKKALATDDLVFFGHDHKAEAITTVNGDGSTFNIIMGGQFNLNIDKECAFNAVTYDSNTREMERLEFNWATKENIFVPVSRGKINKKKKGLAPTDAFLNMLLEDKQNIRTHFTDYYVLPKLAAEGDAFSSDEHVECIGIDDIFSAVKTDKAIRITGNSGSGKTALLRYLYSKSIELGFMPILIEKRDYKDSRIDKMFRDLFEEQYGNMSEHGYNTYEQADRASQIVFIDDVDLISNQKAQENLIARIIESGKLLICTTKEKKQDLEEIVKAKLQGKTISTIDIKPFYKETRDKLVGKVCGIYGKRQDEIDAIKTALDYMVQCQTSLFSFMPVNMLQYIKYFLQGGAGDRKGVQTISMVFETNIRNSILSCEKDSVANVYLMVLEYIADQMYFGLQTERINISDLERIIKGYNSKKKADIIAKRFLNSCVEAHILKEDDNSFSVSFFDKNTFAYFVAKSINRELEKDQTNLKTLSFVMNHICFGINDTIILFLSFIRNNVNIILRIADDAIKLMGEYPEWDFEKMNIPFLHESADISDKLPSSQDKKNAHWQVEQIEKERHDMIKFRGIFDYDVNDVNKEHYIVMRALKYSQLIGRALIDQYGALDADEIDKILQTLYSVPQKVIYAMLKRYQDHSENIVHSIIEFAKERMPDEVIKEDYVRKLIGQVGTFIALNIMNDIAYNASNENTITALRDGPLDNANHKIMLLMMEENVGNTPQFVSRAITLRKELDSCYYARTLIAQIARKHIIYTENIDHREIDRLLSGKVMSSDSKSILLLEQGKNSKS